MCGALSTTSSIVPISGTTTRPLEQANHQGWFAVKVELCKISLGVSLEFWLFHTPAYRATVMHYTYGVSTIEVSLRGETAAQTQELIELKVDRVRMA